MTEEEGFKEKYRKCQNEYTNIKRQRLTEAKPSKSISTKQERHKDKGQKKISWNNIQQNNRKKKEGKKRKTDMKAKERKADGSGDHAEEHRYQ